MKDTPQTRIKVHAVIGIITGVASIAAMITGQFFLAVITITTSWLSLWNIGNLNDELRKERDAN